MDEERVKITTAAILASDSPEVQMAKEYSLTGLAILQAAPENLAAHRMRGGRRLAPSYPAEGRQVMLEAVTILDEPREPVACQRRPRGGEIPASSGTRRRVEG